jgi:hypothetical protein
MSVDVKVAAAGTVIEQTVTFDNLSRGELGGLLATFEPWRVLPVGEDARLRLHLGGGKPIGLGSCHATMRDLTVWTAHSRYSDHAMVSADHAGYVEQFAAGVSSGVKQTWPALAAVLNESTVDPARVSYPPGARWSQRADDAKEFDKPFAFFTATSGMYLAHGQRPLQPLPEPTAADQSLPIISDQDL